MQIESQIDGSNRVKFLLRTGRILVFLSLAVMLAIILFTLVLVPPLLKPDQSEISYVDGCQQLIGHELRLLVENFQIFNQQLQEIPKDEIAPEPLLLLFHGEQPESLDSIFSQIAEIARVVAEAPTGYESVSETKERPSGFPVLAIVFLSFANSILCLAILAVLWLIGKQIPIFREETDFRSETKPEKEEERAPSPPTSKISDPLAIFIGKDAAENILGAMYQAVYAYENQLADVKVGYIVNIASQFLDRFQSQYDLQPIGQPGEGLLEYDPQRHVCWEFAQKGEPVWVVQPGWIHGSKVYAKALVSTKKRPIIS